jgi:hypothetical protein
MYSQARRTELTLTPEMDPTTNATSDQQRQVKMAEQLLLLYWDIRLCNNCPRSHEKRQSPQKT